MGSIDTNAYFFKTKYLPIYSDNSIICFFTIIGNLLSMFIGIRKSINSLTHNYIEKYSGYAYLPMLLW